MSWYHGTSYEPFEDWRHPVNFKESHEVGHSAIFFTQEIDFARVAGPNIARVRLSNGAKIIRPEFPGKRSASLRKVISESNDVARACYWLKDDKTWCHAWRTGEVMRVQPDHTRPGAINMIERALQYSAAEMQQLFHSRGQAVPENELYNQVRQNLTRGWIELIVAGARELGFQAIRGYEIDRHTYPDKKPLSRSWLAVIDKEILSAPDWTDRVEACVKTG